MSEMKVCPCVFCDEEVEVTKFASPAKVRCEEHKDRKIPRNIIEIQESPLAEAVCPQDPTHSVEIKKWISSQRGDVVTHQCHDCLTIIMYSTQHIQILQPTQEVATCNGPATIEESWHKTMLGVQE